ncbi:MAG: pro-sigmaK processing inhibitor BofA family protein [Candidatus Micrarchaeia archaeon]
MGTGMLFALVLSVGIFYILFHLVRKIAPLVYHGIVGMAVFWLLNFLGVMSIPMDWITFAIAALAGVLGVLIVIGLAAMGIKF